MRLSLLVLAVVLVTVLLVSESEEGWIRRAIRRVRIRIRTRGLRRSIRRVGRWVRKHRRQIHTGFVVTRVLGKRSADPNCPGDRMSQAKAGEILNNLKLSCPEFAINPAVGLRKEVVLDAFDAVDTDNNDNLTAQELDNLEDVLEAYEACEWIAATPPPAVV